MHDLQVLAQLATFPASCSPMSESQQQRALTELLHTACTAPQAQTNLLESLNSVRSISSDQAAVSDMVCSALGSMARLGYEDLLSSIALPRLFATAGLPTPNLAHPGAPNLAQPGGQGGAPTERTAGERAGFSAAPAAEETTSMHSGSEGVGGLVSQAKASGRPVSMHMALRALASIAKASRQLRAPILAACIAGVPAALHAAAAGDDKDSLAPWRFFDIFPLDTCPAQDCKGYLPA